MAPRALRIGLLGGSFNPAHAGHRHLSLLALKRLRLDQVWWLVSPQNPLKPTTGMAPLAERMALARKVARHPRIRVTGIEARLRTRHTAMTLKRLKSAFPEARFVWLMGADNLVQIPHWFNWKAIFAAVPIAVFDRGSYSYMYKALAGRAAQSYSRYRLPPDQARALADREPPAWVYVREMRRHPASATAIRRKARGTWEPTEPVSAE